MSVMSYPYQVYIFLLWLSNTWCELPQCADTKPGTAKELYLLNEDAQDHLLRALFDMYVLIARSFVLPFWFQHYYLAYFFWGCCHVLSLQAFSNGHPMVFCLQKKGYGDGYEIVVIFGMLDMLSIILLNVDAKLYSRIWFATLVPLPIGVSNADFFREQTRLELVFVNSLHQVYHVYGSYSFTV